MAETIVENEICLTCGTELPNDALFCYSCGNSVDPETISDANDNEDIESALYDEDRSEETEDIGELQTEYLEEIEVDEIDEDESKNLNEIDEISPSKKPKGDILENTVESAAEIEEKPKLKKEELKSAASIRVRSKIKQQKKVEISWEEHENSPNIWFIGVALFLTAFAICAYFLAMYLR